MDSSERVMARRGTPHFSVIFLACLAVLLAFLTPNVNTGDAGELITSAYHLSIAHPSGYPLYLLLGKAFTFLPFGNIAFKVALVSAVFSALSLALVYLLIFRFTRSNTAAVFTIVLLMTSFSYLHQSVIAKFYPLNLFLILSTCYLWLVWMDSPGSGSVLKAAHLLYLTSFLLGLISTNHNTGMVILGPLLMGIILSRKELRASLAQHDVAWRAALKCVGIFSSGFVINCYLLLRGGENRLANVFHVTCVEDLVRFITRQTYGEIGTLSVASHLFAEPIGFWHGLVNFVSILTANFGFFSWPLFLAGGVYLARKSWRLSAFAGSAFLLYGPVLARLALPSKSPAPTDLYVAGHQYFLPALALYSLFAGFGFFQVTSWLRISKHGLMSKSLLAAVGLFLIAMLFVRYQDSNYRTNYVPYQTAKDTSSILPVNSIYLAFGDNERFQGRYLKLVGKYREDVCHVNAIVIEKTSRGIGGCTNASYSSLSPQGFREQLAEMMPYLATMRFFSDGKGSDAFPVEGFVKVKKFSFLYLYLPSDGDPAAKTVGSTGADICLSDRLSFADRLINPDVCKGQYINDLFTSVLCRKYTSHSQELIRLYLSGRYRAGSELDR